MFCLPSFCQHIFYYSMLFSTCTCFSTNTNDDAHLGSLCLAWMSLCVLLPSPQNCAASVFKLNVKTTTIGQTDVVATAGPDLLHKASCCVARQKDQTWNSMLYGRVAKDPLGKPPLRGSLLQLPPPFASSSQRSPLCKAWRQA